MHIIQHHLPDVSNTVVKPIMTIANR